MSGCRSRAVRFSSWESRISVTLETPGRVRRLRSSGSCRGRVPRSGITIPIVRRSTTFAILCAMRRLELSDTVLRAVDAVVIATDHTGVDYQQVADQARLVVDARGVMRTAVRGKARVIGISGSMIDLASRPKMSAEKVEDLLHHPDGTA